MSVWLLYDKRFDIVMNLIKVKNDGYPKRSVRADSTLCQAEGEEAAGGRVAMVFACTGHEFPPKLKHYVSP